MKQRKNLAKRLERDPEYSRDRQKAWEHKGRNRLRARLRKCYGMSLAEYDALLTAQGNKCALCKKDFVEGQRIAVDHCHGSGKVRNLLHINCNTAIGLLLDSPELCRMAAAYLEKHTDLA